MKLSDVILSLQQEASGITTNPLLIGMNRDFLRKVEDRAEGDEGLKRLHDEMVTIAVDVHLEDLDKQRRLFTAYGEAKFYLYLKSKGGVVVEVIPREHNKKILISESHMMAARFMVRSSR